MDVTSMGSACATARGLIAALIDRLREHSGWADRGAQTDMHEDYRQTLSADRQTASLREHSGLIAALRPSADQAGCSCEVMGAG